MVFEVWRERAGNGVCEESGGGRGKERVIFTRMYYR